MDTYYLLPTHAMLFKQLCIKEYMQRTSIA